jgi:hypothetical protein
LRYLVNALQHTLTHYLVDSGMTIANLVEVHAVTT